MMPWLTAGIVRRVLRHPPTPLRVLSLLVAILTYGTTGFLYFELPSNPALRWSDGLWYSIVTVTTVGYGDYSPSTLEGRFLVATPLMFFGIGLLGYVLSILASALIEQKSKEAHGMGQYDFSEHLVVCNCPNVGTVVSLLEELGADAAFDRTRGVVLIDADLAEIPKELEARDLRFVRGEPSSDEALARAAVEHAKSVVVLSKPANDPSSDHLTVAIVLAVSARAPKAHLVAQCVDPTRQGLLRNARASRIVCTGQFGTHFVATELLNPGVLDVVADLTSSLQGEQLYVDTYHRTEEAFSCLVERCKASGHLLIGIRREGQIQLNPPEDFRVRTSDQLVTIGPRRLQLKA
jgi:voltage-gated potassium channel